MIVREKVTLNCVIGMASSLAGGPKNF